MPVRLPLLHWTTTSSGVGGAPRALASRAMHNPDLFVFGDGKPLGRGACLCRLRIAASLAALPRLVQPGRNSSARSGACSVNERQPGSLAGRHESGDRQAPSRPHRRSHQSSCQAELRAERSWRPDGRLRVRLEIGEHEGVNVRSVWSCVRAMGWLKEGVASGRMGWCAGCPLSCWP